MARLTSTDARYIAKRFGIPLDRDFHALGSAEVDSILAAADARGYRKPPNASGSRARSFHAYLVRAAASLRN